MADKVSYTINDWHKSDVLTAEKLNATEAALARVVAMINGNSESQSVTLTKSELIASEAYVDDAINDLDYTPTEDEAHTPSAIKTIASLTESGGIINATYQEIQKASGTDFGVVKAGTNLSASEGTLSVIDSPVLSGSLTLDGAFEHSIKADEQLQAKVPHEVFNAAYKTITLGATPASLQDGESWAGTITANNASTITLQGYKTIIDAPLTLNDNFIHSTETTSYTTSNNVTGPNGSFTAKYKTITLGAVAKIYKKSDNTFYGNSYTLSTNIYLEGNTTEILTDRLYVSSTSTFSNSLTVGTKTVTDNTTTLTGSTTLYGTVNIEGGTTLSGALSVSGSSTLSGGITTSDATITTANITEATMTIATATNATITDATITNINDGFTILHSNNNNENISLYSSLGDESFSIRVIKDNNNSNVFSIDVVPISENDSTSIRTNLAIQCPINLEVSAENAIDTNGVIMSASNESQTVYALTDDGHISLAGGIIQRQTDNNNNILMSEFVINYNKILNVAPEMVLHVSKGDTTWNIFTHNFSDTLLIGDSNINTIMSGPIEIEDDLHFIITDKMDKNDYTYTYKLTAAKNTGSLILNCIGADNNNNSLTNTPVLLQYRPYGFENTGEELSLGGTGIATADTNCVAQTTIRARQSIVLSPRNGQVNVNSNLTIQLGHNLTIGQTTLTEQNLQDLLTLLN